MNEFEEGRVLEFRVENYYRCFHDFRRCLTWLIVKSLRTSWELRSSQPGRKPHKASEHRYLGGGFEYLLFSPLFGEDSYFEKSFSTGLKPPTSYSAYFTKLNKQPLK